MKILLDTHIFLWFISGDSRLSVEKQEILRSSKNEIFLSVASIWEVLIKFQLGKLVLPNSPEIYLPQQRDQHQIASLSIDEQSIEQLALLPPLHRDPFDRILIAQALQHNLIIATVDRLIQAYSVKVL